MNRKLLYIIVALFSCAATVFFLSTTTANFESSENFVQTYDTCSSSLSFTVSKIQNCTVTASIMLEQCQNKMYEIRGTECTGTIFKRSDNIVCSWQNYGEKTYELYIDGVYIDSIVVDCAIPEQEYMCQP